MKNKYTYLFILQGFYGSWDDLTESKSSKEVRDDRKAYRDNGGGSYRIIRRRGLNVA